MEIRCCRWALFQHRCKDHVVCFIFLRALLKIHIYLKMIDCGSIQGWSRKTFVASVPNKVIDYARWKLGLFSLLPPLSSASHLPILLSLLVLRLFLIFFLALLFAWVEMPISRYNKLIILKGKYWFTKKPSLLHCKAQKGLSAYASGAPLSVFFRKFLRPTMLKANLCKLTSPIFSSRILSLTYLCSLPAILYWNRNQILLNRCINPLYCTCGIVSVPLNPVKYTTKKWSVNMMKGE